MSLFITGTDTGVGKTHIAARLLHLLRASGMRCAGMKPICCGDRRDAEALLAAGSDCVTIDEVNPVWLKTPAAPIVGSLTENVGLVLNSTEMTGDIAALTDADILKRILNVPLLAGLGENLTELPVEWRLMLDSTTQLPC